MSDGRAATASEADGGAIADASALCVSCGLCCNGILFTNARADPDEVPRLRALGLEVEEKGERLQFRLPCPHHAGGHCGIYDRRFAKCRSFRCALLKRLDAGEVTLAEASATVERAKQMVARVAELDPDAALLRVRAEQRTAGPSAEAGAQARLWIESVALDLFLDRKFRNNSMFGSPPPEAASDREGR